MPPSAAR